MEIAIKCNPCNGSGEINVPDIGVECCSYCEGIGISFIPIEELNKMLKGMNIEEEYG